MEGQLKLLSSVFLDTKENIDTVVEQLSHVCSACRLSLIHPINRGLVWRGSLKAKIGVIGEAPGDEETQTGRPFVGNAGKEWEKWAKFAGIDTRDNCFISNVLQCQPPKAKKSEDEKAVQQAPEREEMSACFKPRALRVLRSLPNLEVVITLGWVAAGALLGDDAKSKTHEGKWFATSLLPGIGVFCLPHPSYLLREPSEEKYGRVEQCLNLFRREYTELRKIPPLALAAKDKLVLTP